MSIEHISDNERIPLEDVGEATREGRALRLAHLYRVLIADDQLNNRDIDLSDPVPTGRQLLEAVNANPVEEHSILAILPNGEFEDLRLDETYDLRGRGIERFIFFKTDHLYKFTIDNRQMEWGKPVISGNALYTLAKPQENESVFLVIRGGEDRQIELNDVVDLTLPGVEHFVNAPKRKPKIEIVVNGREEVVMNSHVTFEQLVLIAYPSEVPDPTIKYSITYRGVVSKPHSGELAAGGSVKVKNGSIFNVTRTIQS